MGSPFHRPILTRPGADAQKLAIFLTADQVRSLVVSVGCLPRAKRDTLRRELEKQLAEHAEVH